MSKKTIKLLFICSLLLLSCKSKKKLTASSNKELSKVERIQKKPKIESSKVIINETTVTNFRKNYRKTFGIGGSLDTLYSAVSNGLKVQGVEQWLPLFYNGLETIFDYLPKAIYFMDIEISYPHLSACNRKYNEKSLDENC